MCSGTFSTYQGDINLSGQASIGVVHSHSKELLSWNALEFCEFVPHQCHVRVGDTTEKQLALPSSFPHCINKISPEPTPG